MPNKRLFSLVSILTLIVCLSISMPIAFGDDDDDVAAIPEKAQLTYPNLSTHLNHLADRYSSGQMSEQQAAGESPIHSGGSVAVTIHLDGHVSELVTFLEENGGDPRNVGEDYIEAYVPVGLLGRLSEQPGVTQVWEIIPPQPAYGNVTSQAVGLHRADSWQDAGFRGQGVKVGVIDVGFTGYSALMGIELPNNVVARCYTDVGIYSSNLADCEAEEDPPAMTPIQCQEYVAGLYAGGEPHGTAVAEAVIDMAPDATLYIANPSSRGDLQATAEWMADQGVTVINYSVVWTFDGPGDGTSPFSDSPLNTVDQAVARDITWVNAAGNSAGDTWFGSFSDPDGDDVIDFNDFGAEINPIVLQECRRYSFLLRWEDNWGGAVTDLDIYLWDKSTGDFLDIPAGYGYVGSIVEQSGANNHTPREFFSLRSPIDSEDVGVIIVHAGGPEPDWIHLDLFSGPGGLEYSTGASIANPAESANPGMLAVGAAPFYDTNTIEPFSSQGPTPDGRIKPDIVGVDCAASVSYEREIRRDDGQECWFPGTSQASPHVAGMAALVRQRFPEFSPEQVADYLKDTAQQRESPDPNNTWGHGLAQLPPPTCGETLTGDGSVSGAWAAGCDSEVSGRGHSLYYSFNLAEESEVTIALESSDADTYLYLRAGDARSGDFLYENDDDGGTTKSTIEETLAAGTYTIEATTYGTGETGSFTLRVSGGIGGDAPGTPSTDPCGQTLTGDGNVSGIWVAGCDSEVAERGHARYYSFTLAEESEVTITLESSDADTYLYLRAGDARSGEFLYENDDDGGTTKSTIEETLAAGTYTIEATTYGTGETGSFTLSMAGLGEATTGPEPGTDECGQTLTADGTFDGTWAAGCDSEVAGRGHARYYSFTLAEESEVTITLESTDADTYLYLRSGEARSGTFLYENDDDGGTTKSTIEETLAAGTYTIEATTYGTGETGSFTLSMAGLGEATTGPEPGTDECGQTLTADGTFDGTWAAGCDSEVAGRGHARYYSFTLAEESEVTITLESTDADTYLYLRSGEARSGTFLYENDDDGGTTKSTIEETLDAGSYTIEATTYGTGETGSFTLTIAGLGDATTPGPDPGTDECGETLTGDGNVSGIWAAGCDSEVAERGHARYYSFTLTEESEVIITLESTDADTYLYLRSGEARSGEFLYENDDDGGTTKSTIEETLAAGTYTIEATTYSVGETGAFSLAVSGLGGATTRPPPVPILIHGQAVLDGNPAPEGTKVIALIHGQEVGIGTVSADGSFAIIITGNRGAVVTFALRVGEGEDAIEYYASADTQVTIGAPGGDIMANLTATSDPCIQTLTADRSVPGTWAAGCDSEVSGRGHARYYSFTLTEESEVTITLESNDADTYLYLRAGDARSDEFLYQNDDVESGNTNSQIVASLSAGTYTIEATTYGTGETGSFTLSVSGLGEATTGPEPGTDECGETLTANGSVSGTWAAGCDSEVSQRGHARYYSFTLTEGAEVTIALESSDADTYLYLRSGEARSGNFLEEDDDTPDTTRSEIVATLSAGSYTIEATTYNEGETGVFMLTISGLGGATTGPTLDPVLLQYAADQAGGPGAIYVGDISQLAGPAPNNDADLADADGMVPLEDLQDHVWLYENSYYRSLLDRANLTNPTPLTSSGQDIAIQFSCINRALTPCMLIENWLAPNLETRTGGQITLEVVSFPELGVAGPDTLRLLSDGTLDMAEIYGGYVGGYVSGELPLLDLQLLPGLYPDHETMLNSVADTLPALQHAIAGATQGGPTINNNWYAGYDTYIFANEPLRNVTDFDGLKTRSFFAAMSEWLDGMGADAQFLALAEVYTALE